jgi:lipoyl(octanoyl) transferase
MAWVVAPGRIPYTQGAELQRRFLQQRIDGEVGDVVIVCEHEPVYTVGRRRGAPANVLAPGGVEVVEVERGGDVTFHGPGQVVVYPIVKLEGPDRDLHRFMWRLEQLMIDVCAEFGLRAGRDQRNTGCWISARKVGSVGISCRKWVTWHGLALNVNTDLSWFRAIRPCGFDAAIMTTMEAELGAPVDPSRVAASFIARLGGW